MRDTLQLVARLRREGDALSRNRNFELFEDPATRRAQKLHLHLLRLERDLVRFARQGRVRLLSGPVYGRNGRLVIEVVVPALSMRRHVYLDARELDLIMEKPEIAEILGEGEERTVDLRTQFIKS